MEVEVTVTVSERGTTLKYTMDGKDMDLADRKNRYDALLICVASMSLLDAICGDKKENGGEENEDSKDN